MINWFKLLRSDLKKFNIMFSEYHRVPNIVEICAMKSVLYKQDYLWYKWDDDK